MSFIEHIEHLQQAPLRKRKIVLAVSVAAIMTAIIALWIMQLRYTLQGETAQAPSIAEPFKLLWGSVKDSISSMKN